jgi:hypothetical protein
MKTPNQLLDDLFAIIGRRSLKMVGARAGVNWRILYTWRSHIRRPTLVTFVAVANTMGYDVVLVKKGSADVCN